MIKTWQQRCEGHPDHEGVVTEQMIRDRMQEEIDELRQALAQPKRKWVGLTEAERVDIIDDEITAPSTEHFALAQTIEAELKEKNT